MDLQEQLKEQGWFLTEEGLKKLTASSNLQVQDVNKIKSMAINWDFKDIASGALPMKPESNGIICGPIVLQIQKMRNISAPKANEESTAAPRFLQLELSDGSCSIPALEFERISSLNLNLPPGTKLLLKSDKLQLSHGFLVLKSSDVQVLGGKVEHLVEKWEVARQMLKYDRSNRRLSGSGGPPPWIAFGKRLDAHKDDLLTDKNFKSLQVVSEKDKNSKENEEFNASRCQAIAEAAKAGQKKVFGGGQQNILDHNVKKILEKGYSEEDANQALKATNNNLERALYNLKRRNNKREISIENKAKPVVSSNGGRGIASVKKEASAAKPQTNVSLFDFLTEKLPVNASNSNPAFQSNINDDRGFKDSSKVSNSNSKATGNAANKFENNMSSSFQAKRGVVLPMPDDKQSLPVKVKSEKIFERVSSNKEQPQFKIIDKTTSQPSTILYEKTHLTDNNKKNDHPIRKENEPNLKQSSSNYQMNKRDSDYKTSDNKSYQSRDNIRNNSNNYQSQQKQKYKRNNYEKDLGNIVESTSKIIIQNKKESSYNTSQSKNNQQYPKNNNQKQLQTPKQQLSHQNSAHKYDNYKQVVGGPQIFSSKSSPQNQKSIEYIDQPGSSFVYDHSKIVGFQSKEANEYAMNLLKSQGLTMQQIHQQQTAQGQSQEVTPIPSLPPPPQQQHLSGQLLNPQTTPTIAYMTQGSNMFIAPCQQPTSQINVMPGGNWTWKIGDLCLAKYWDDGHYYDAKITAVSEKTCVVLFLGYGNHEEVLKSDCLPITDAQHIPINAFQANIAVSPLQQPPLPFQQRNSLQSGGMGSNQRNRGERQMYIPPPKRTNY